MQPLLLHIAVAFSFVVTQLVLSSAEQPCCNNTELTDLINDLRNVTRVNRDELIEEMGLLNLLVLTVTRQILDDLLEHSIFNVYRYKYSPFLRSCKDIKTTWPNSTSGNYLITGGNGEIRDVFCKMEEICNSDEGWMRVAFLNMSNPWEICPSGFRYQEYSGLRTCGRKWTKSKLCQSLKFPTHALTYSEVCGHIRGYQYASTDAFRPHNRNNMKSIDQAYVDGISLTHGSPRKHIWTFAAGIQENHVYASGYSDCPCAPGSVQYSPDFVGSSYFCESGNPQDWRHGTFYPEPLWDGQDCGAIEQGCCAAPGLPWFHKRLHLPTSDYIELRLCSDQGTDNEDIPFDFYEIYIK